MPRFLIIYIFESYYDTSVLNLIQQFLSILYYITTEYIIKGKRIVKIQNLEEKLVLKFVITG